MRMPRITKAAVVVGAAALVLTACSSLTWDQKVEHLRDMANKGADAHYVLKTENKETSQEVCAAHYKVFTEGAPLEHGFGAANSTEWTDLSQAYFVDSCVKGEPRQIQTRPATPSSTPSTTATPTATSVSPSPAG